MPCTAPAARSTDIPAAGLRRVPLPTTAAAPLPLTPGPGERTRPHPGPRVIDPPMWTPAGRPPAFSPPKTSPTARRRGIPPSPRRHARTLLAIFSLGPTSPAAALKAGPTRRSLPASSLAALCSIPPTQIHPSPAMPAPAPPPSPLLPPAGEPFRVFVGYDPREHEAYEVCRRSLLRRASIPLDVRPIRQPELRDAGLYTRARGPTESTEFSFTRFLTPYLAGYRGWALFVDCDFLYVADLAELLAAAVPPSGDADRLAVVCVKHEYQPAEATKMDGAIQTVYPRKNWSSMVLYNCAHPKNVAALTPDAVSTQTGAFLHRFAWLDDDEIGEVPFAWNFLVGHNKVDPADPATRPKAIHYTAGGPWFERYRDCEFADLWLKEAAELRADKEDKLQEEAEELGAEMGKLKILKDKDDAAAGVKKEEPKVLKDDKDDDAGVKQEEEAAAAQEKVK